MFIQRTRKLAAIALLCSVGATSAAPYDPLRQARASTGFLANREAVIPIQCYTRTDGVANPCWTCHTGANGLNRADDWGLQLAYAFTAEGLVNHWLNAFAERPVRPSSADDERILQYIRTDNYAPLRKVLATRIDYAGWRPDLDFSQGFDEQGFARDGSWWRAFRYKPFPGTFWPTNGSSDDVMIRLPWPFRSDRAGAPSREIYKINLAILEAAVAVADTVADDSVRRSVEPLDESSAGVDLDGDGRSGIARNIARLPRQYVGGAAAIAVRRYLYPPGTEFLHTVRYVDPDAPGLLSRRMKEVRYSTKIGYADSSHINVVYRQERDHKARGLLPHYIGRPDSGLRNDFGWQLQGFIEDAQGRLRLQTVEEHYWCMGCHGTIGVTVDQTFGFPRKLPGAPGWGHQTLAGMKDVPQAGHREPEVLTYFRRVGGGDEFRSNAEIGDRFFKRGRLDEQAVRRAAPGGDRDLQWLLAPTRARALALDQAYMALVQEQKFALGRDAFLAPPHNVHREIRNGTTGFDPERGVYRDGRLWLDWSAVQ